ncbi:MAG: hypothetical protein GEU92_05895 [Alphaproteobacteria bacterium]|nr:hypothetical protein [Alphaproteobacteria bacterium]
MMPVQLRRALALAGCLFALSGCAMLDAMKPLPERAPKVPPRDAVQQAAVPLTPPLPGGESSPGAGSGPGAVKPLQPKALVGMTPDEIRAMLGAPASERSDPPATVWTWRHERCEVDVFFYMDIGNQTFRALTYEFRGAKRREARCLGALKEETDRGRRAQN